MQLVNLQLNDFPKYIGEPKFGISTWYWQLYWFYSCNDGENSQSHRYHVICDSTSRKTVIPDEYVELYADYGIDFNEKVRDTRERRYIMVIKLDDLLDEAHFQETVTERYREFDNSEVGLVFVDYGSYPNLNHLSHDFILQMAAMICNAFPNAIIANSEISLFDVSIESSVPEVRNSTDIDSVVTIEQLQGNKNIYSQTEIVVSTMLNLIDILRKSNYTMFDASKSKIATLFSTGNKAAISYISLMRYNKIVYFDSNSYNVMYALSNIMSKQDAMYADEFLNRLENLPDVSVYMTGNEPILVMPDCKKSFVAKYRVQILECEMDLNTLKLHGKAQPMSYSNREIELLSVATLFNLSSADAKIAEDGMNRLKKLMGLFMYRCKHILDTNSDMNDILLNISNVIFYRYEGQTFMGYLSYVTAEQHFMAYPVRQKSKPFHIVLDVAKESLIDVRMFEDWQTVLAPYVKAGIVRKEKIFFHPQRYIRGLCLYGMQGNYLEMKNSIGLTFEEVGMYSESSWCLRKSQVILEHVKKDFVDSYIATPFGGMHPMINTKVKIRREDWRSDGNKIQQFNTYGY